MPTYDFVCEVCGIHGREYRREGQPPRFCSRECRKKGIPKTRTAKTKYVITPEIHEMIKHVYQDMTGNGEVNRLAARLGLPRWKISRYATAQGWIAQQKKEPDWSEQELHILEQNAHHTVRLIQKRLAKYGFHRSESGIIQKRKRMRYLQNLNGQSATSLALCFGSDIKTITRWIFQGYLKATKRGTARTAAQGGDQWWIKENDVRRFVMNNAELIDIRKVDKFWFIDMLANG